MTGFAAGFRMVADPDLAQEIDRDCVKREVFTVQKVQHPWVTRGMGVKALAVGLQDAECTFVDKCRDCLPLVRGYGGEISTSAAL